jgi:radical SAM-linked protein
MERAFRIAQLPLAFSQGFSPHPRVSFGLALPTGCESDAEYLDLMLCKPVDLDALLAPLTEALPVGIEITGAVELADRAPALQEAVTAVEWRVEIEPVADARERVATALNAPTLETMRRRKGREVVEDVRPVVRSMEINDQIVAMKLNTQPRGAKPGEVLSTMGLTELRARRTHQWIERDGARLEPLDADLEESRPATTAKPFAAVANPTVDTRSRAPEACAS